MKVYVITCGEYSDYQVCAVTLDKEQAELLQVRYSDKWNEAYIDEYETDDYKIEAADLDRHMYQVTFNKDHEISSCRVINRRLNYKHGEVEDESTWFNYANGRRSCFNWRVDVYVDTKDEDHAKKIAKDIYMKWLAEQNNL